ncbi:MAG: cupin domain-containing protein [Pseudomonadota bacterium]
MATRSGMAVLVLAAVLGLSLAQAQRKPMPRKVAIVKGSERPLHLIADGKAGARVLLDAESSGQTALSLTTLTMLPGCVIASHSHADATEVLYLESGRGLLTFGSSEREVGAGDALYLPPGVPHSFKVQSQVEPVRAVQIYLPGGSEQRFLKGAVVPD